MSTEVKDKLVYILGQEQQAAHDWLVKFCLGKTPEYRRSLLTGYAGTGKTFTMNRIVEIVKEINPDIQFGMTTPTHKAVRVLKKHSEKKNELTFGTIHSFLALKEHLNERTGEMEFKPDFNPSRERKIDQITILIVDESSMLQDALFEYIEDELRSNSILKVIYMGDPLQIPPVRGKEEKKVNNEKGIHRDAIPFQLGQQQSRKISVLSLTEPQRQAADSPIIMYATAIREQHKRPTINFEFKDEYKSALELIPRNLDILKKIFTQYFKTPQFEADPDYFKVICWRNESTNYFNQEIRLLIHDATTLPLILVGEKMIMDAPLLKGEKILIPNNEDVVVKRVDVIDYPIPYRMKSIKTIFDQLGANSEEELEREMKTWICKVYSVTLTNADGMNFDTIVLHEDSEEMFKTIQNEMKHIAKNHSDQYARKEMWKQFYAMQRKFAWVKYNYCITAHKAQGSTYDYSLSMEWDIDQNWVNEERNRIRYVAATRARHKLFIVK